MAEWVPDPVAEVTADSRGILRPWELARFATLTRYPATELLSGIVDRFWATTWNLPVGRSHEQQVLTHPCANLVVAPDLDEPYDPVGQLNGVATGLTRRVLVGHGWSVAAMTTPGGLGALLTSDAEAVTDRTVPLVETLSLQTDLVERVTDAADEASRVAVLAAALEARVRGVEPARVGAAREVASIAALAERDRSICTTRDLCAAAGVGVRTLQRQFREYVGVPPAWVIRRYRLLEVAELARDGTPVRWAEVASQLGYSDQSHLIRDFVGATGVTPAGYAQTAGDARPGGDGGPTARRVE